MSGRTLRIALAGAGVLVALAAALALVAFRGGGTVELRGTAIQGTPRAPGFRLADAEGRPVALAAAKGVTLVTFLYVHCPDVCPLIAQRLNEALPRLGDDARVLAVSVDPKGDTPAAVRRYERERHLRPAFRYLVGTQGQLAPVWKAYYVGAQRVGGTVMHSAETYLVDRDGRERVRYDAAATAADIEHDVHALGL